MNVVIIEDEKITAERLTQLLHKVDHSINVLAVIGTVREAVNWLSNNDADLIFLDIQLSDGSCFGIFEQIDIKTPVIFTTAYDQYTLKAFKVNSIDYLLKPVDINELSSSIEKFRELFGKKVINAVDLRILIEELDNRQNQYKKRFIVNIGRKIKIIYTKDIAYFFAFEKNVFICTSDNQHIAIDHSLETVENLVDPDCFFRINRKYIVNINSIKDIFTFSKSRVKVILNPPAAEDVIISYERSGYFKKWLNQ
jgi:two-component system response regulator LytT